VRRLAVAAVLAGIAACGDPSTAADAPSAIDGASPVDATPVTFVATGYPVENRDPGDLTWVAYQDGDGAWQRATSDGAGVYTLVLANRAYGLAYACPGPDGVDVAIYHATTDEIPALAMRCFIDAPMITVSGTVTGSVAGRSVAVFIGDRSASATGPELAYSRTVAPGVHDVLVVEADPIAPRRVHVLRGVDLTSDTTLDIDLSGAADLVANAWTADIPDAAIFAQLWADRGGRASFFAGQPSASWWGAPSTVLAGADLHRVRAQTPDGTRRVTRYLRDPAPLDFVLPAPLDTSAFAASVAATSPYVRITTTGTGSQAAHLHELAVAAADRYWWTAITRARAPGAAFDVTTPDFSGVAGFDPLWALPPGGDGYASLIAFESNRPDDALPLLTEDANDRPPPPNLDGVEVRYSAIYRTLPL
jgi:hypothetical protein